LLVLMVAYGAYYFTLWATPRAVLLSLKFKAKSELNTPFYNDVVTDRDRMVALPNPDFLYVAMGYDIRSSDLILSGKMPDSTYYSMALYDTDTRNYFRVNDRQCPDKAFNYRLTKQKTESEDRKPIIVASTPVGFLLIRILITDPSQVEYLKEIQQSFTVEKVE
jgi:uncharacterized membrane protein